MILGAFIDAGLDPLLITGLPQKLNLSHVEIIVSEVTRNHLRAAHVSISYPKEQKSRNLKDIYAIIAAGDISGSAKKLAKKIFDNLAKAEARVHNTTPDKIHFHEVGAIDAIIDITGAAVACDALKIGRSYVSKISAGAGWAKMAHGIYPVPAPATAYLLEKFTIQPGPVDHELITPTAAAILSTIAEDTGSFPSFKIEKIGYGAGTANFERHPNVLRIFIGSQETTERQDHILMLECNIDDMNPQLFPFIIEKLIQGGALDAYITTVVMKKGRPGFLLSALCYPQDEAAVQDIIFSETTTIGIRKQFMTRNKLSRKSIKLDTTFGIINVKEILLPDGTPRRLPEFEDCKRIALKTGRPLQLVREQILNEINQD